MSCPRLGGGHEAARIHLAVLGGAAAAWPLAARAQQPERMRRIGVLMGLAEDDPEMKARLAGFRQGLERLGWSEGRNVRIDSRFAPATPIRRRCSRKSWSPCNQT